MSRSGKNNKGGRPKGQLLQKTIDKNRMLAEFRNKASKMANTFLMAQAQEALGTYQIVKKNEIYNKKGKMVSVKWEVVSSKSEIDKVMNEFKEIDGQGEIDGKYYMITRDKPSYKASDAILNRAFGKPIETINHSDKDGQPLIIILDK